MKRILLIFLCTLLLPLFLISQYRVVISEVLYDTPVRNEGQYPYRHNGEFVGLFNYGSESVNVSGWRLVGGPGQTFTFPQGSIMQPRARFFVAYRSRYRPNFRLEDMFENFRPGTNDIVFYMNVIRLPNGGGGVRLFRADGAMQDSIRYDGTSNRDQNPRLEAHNGVMPSRAYVSLQRRNITVNEPGTTAFCRLDWSTDVVALAEFPKLSLIFNGKCITQAPPAATPRYRTVFAHDASGNRTGRRTIVLPAPQSQSVPPVPSRARVAAANTDAANEEENVYYSTEEAYFLASNTMKMPEDNVFLDNFYTDRLNESDVVIFPNPTRGALAVEIRNMNPEIPHRIAVLNLNGLVVFQRDNIGAFTEIDLSSQPRGVYLLRISSPDSFITWTIIKE